MKRVPAVTATVIAVLNFISVLARQTGDTTAIANTLNNFADSIQVYNYISRSKNYININSDSSLWFADLAVRAAYKTNNEVWIDDALKQKQLVEQANLARIRKQNNVFDGNETTNNNSVLLILVSLILFVTCICLSVLYRRKNYVIKELETSNTHFEQRNNELMLFQKETMEKNAAMELEKQTASPETNVKVSTLKDSLIPMLAHDIRSPLASLQHMLTLTRENVLNPEEFQKLSLALEADIYNLRGILDNMLLWTREQMIEVKVNKTLFDVSEAMQNVILMLRNNLVTKNITVKNYLEPDLMVFSDKDIITAVLRNIFSNAVKFTEPNKNIFISQIYFNKKIFISVKDEGKGINDEVLEKINKGEHITTKGTSNEKGTGIGLMFTKDLLKKINEVFDLTTLPGNGTSATFSVSLHQTTEQV